MNSSRRFASLAMVVAATGLWGCASVERAPEAADAAAKQFAPVANAAAVYVYRNETLGAAVPMALAVNG